jgi:hypothetical protein
MNTGMLRTIQVGVALLVLTIASLAVGVLVGVVDQQDALRIGTNVSAIIVIFLVASLGLTAVFGVGSDTKNDE